MEKRESSSRVRTKKTSSVTRGTKRRSFAKKNNTLSKKAFRRVNQNRFKKKPKKPINPNPDQQGVRLQKALSGAGVCSRRKAEEMISEGRVTVNGVKITEQGTRIDPAQDVVKVSGTTLYLKTAKLSYVFNKPANVLTSMELSDRHRTLPSFIPKHLLEEGLFHIGRLDKDTQGLLLLTNDGELANKISHPSSNILKTYLARLEGVISKTALKQLANGVKLEDGISRFDSVKLVSYSDRESVIEIVIHSGKNRIIRRTLAALKLNIIELHRVKIGGVILGNLKPGKLRKLTREQIEKI
jgi:23S rRNA pseudouridine2605 synthase